MIKGSPKKPIRLEAILDKIEPYDIYRFYLGRDFKIGKNTASPFHSDSDPSFNINVASGGQLFHIDFGDRTKTGNCFKFVQQLYGIGFQDALLKIDIDFGLGLWSDKKYDYRRIIADYKKPKILKAKKECIIQVITKKYTNLQLKYWNDYHLDRSEIKEDNVFSIQKLYVNKKLINTQEICFGYFYESGWKIYTPFAGKGEMKWISNIPLDLMDGLKELVPGPLAFIQKSKKDKLVAKKFVKNTASTQNESPQSISPSNIEFLQRNFDRTILQFDPDRAGVTACTYYNQFGFGYVNTDKSYIQVGVKDLADMSKGMGLNEVEKFLKVKNIIG